MCTCLDVFTSKCVAMAAGTSTPVSHLWLPESQVQVEAQIIFNSNSLGITFCHIHAGS